VINQLELDDSTGFDGSSREAEIRFGRIRVAARAIMNQHEDVGRMDDRGLKDFARVSAKSGVGSILGTDTNSVFC
jgi:hypothetical protein